jgi:hypothetical protein
MALPKVSGLYPQPSMTMRTKGRGRAARVRRLGGADDGGEGVHLEAGAAHQGAVDVRLGEELGGVARGHAAPVEDGHAVGHLPEQLVDAGDDVDADLLGLGRGGGPAGADRPHRLVSDDQLPVGEVVHVLQGAAQLAVDDRHGRLLQPLRLGLAHRQDDPQVVAPGGGQLAGDQLVALTDDVTALGVTEQDVVAKPGEHRGGDLAGEGPLVLGVAVLGAEPERAALEHLADPGQMGEGGKQLHLHGAAVQRGAQRAGQLQPLGNRRVHLPVAGDQRGGTAQAHSATFSSRAATPGSSLPSRYSRVAPPPVEMWLILSATPA